MSNGPPPDHFQNPMPGTTILTTPRALGLTTQDPQPESSSTDSMSKSNIVKRAVERTAEKLGRRPSKATKPSNQPKRVFSLKRRQQPPASSESESHSEQDTDDEADTIGSPDPFVTALSHPPPRRPPTTPPEIAGVPPNVQETPGSSSSQRPYLSQLSGISRPPLDGSLRQGTQTLIQALQAIPWERDDEGPITPSDGTPLSDDDDDDTGDYNLSSSIHTIHRSRRPHFAASYTQGGITTSPEDYFANHPDEYEEEGVGEADFERPPNTDRTPAIKISPRAAHTPRLSPPSSKGKGINMSASRIAYNRTTSVATVRVQRRAQLASKLREVFELKDIEEVVAEMPCWLLRSVLLQGYMYLTNAHMCFFAHMPAREDQVLKSGTLSKKASRMKRWNKHWFILKNDVLSWYQSSADPYFPHGNVDLRYAISCDPAEDMTFKLRTNQKTIILAADSIPSREEWVKAIRKIIFKVQNMGDSVKIAIPYSVILEVERSTAMDFSDTVEVKVVDREDNYAMDSYFFAYFHDLPLALDQIRQIVAQYRTSQTATPSSLKSVSDTTVHRTLSATPSAPGRALSMPQEVTSSSGFKLGSLLRWSSSTDSASTPEGFTHVTSGNTLSPPRPRALDRPHSSPPDVEATLPTRISSRGSSNTITNMQHNPSDPNHHTYPPSSPRPQLMPHIVAPPMEEARSSWSVGVPSWLKAPSRRLFSTSTSGSTEGGEDHCSEVYERPGSDDELDHSQRASMESSSNQLGFSILEAPESEPVPDASVIEKFGKYFALGEKEVLLGYIPGYLFRVLPVSGRMYISTNYFCFRSTQPLMKTRMIIPIRDILATEKQKAFRFGHHGMIVVIRRHEELFFEFGTVDRRDACMNLIERQMQEHRQRLQAGGVSTVTQGQKDALVLEELESSTSLSDFDIRPPPENTNESLPAVMFTSTSSTFLSFKPTEKLHFTCLTIGSRGDVQPYIALCKGLQADGHKTRIATHLEYKDWIEGHGIEYGAVGGDPAELMRICVENGMFTVSFLKEGLQKFRGWLDDLLASSWDACQGTDVLIESPSAMGGLHIAEALRIPYFRAFTMPWTRTRAYPHAFAVPDHKMGGGYNYMTYVMFDQVFWRATAGQINRWRRNVLGIGNTSLDLMEQHKVPFLYNFSPSVVPPPLDWYEWIRVTGYWFLDDADDSNSKKWTPPVDLLPFIDGAHAQGKKVVYIGFGSIVVSDPEAMTKCVVEAILQSGVHAILSKGWSDRLSTKKGVHSDGDELPAPPLPSQIYSLTSVPHDWLFPKIDAACHHGGAGTTGASLRAGIPTIIKPFFGDQFFWGDRVEALGIGSSVRKLTVENLTEALKTATTDPKQINRAKVIGESIRAEKGVANAVDTIYRDLEYARSLIKRPTDEDTEQERTPRAERSTSPGPQVRHSSSNSFSGSLQGGGMSDGWSVISDENGSSSLERRKSGDVQRSSSKRISLASTTLSVLSDAFSIRHNSRQSLGPSDATESSLAHSR